MLYTDLRINDSIKIGEAIITLIEKNGCKIKLSIQAVKDVKIEIIRNKKQGE